MIGRILVTGALVVATWGGVVQTEAWIDSAHRAAVGSDLHSSTLAIQGYVEEHGAPSGRFVVAGQRQLDDGTDLTVSEGDTLTAAGTWSGSYCVVVHSTAGQTRYYDSALALISSNVVPGGACAAVVALGAL